MRSKIAFDHLPYADGKNNKLKIAYVCGDSAGPAWHEIYVPCKHMSETGKVYAEMFEGVFSSEPLFNFDIVVFQRQNSDVAYHVLTELKKRGIKTVYHFTDNLWEIPPGNPARAYYQQKDIMERINKMIRTVDMVTCTTPPLKDIALEFNPYVRRPWELVEVDEVRSLLPPPRREDDTEVRIGWILTPHHEDDIYLVVNSMGQIARQYPNVKFIFFGYFNEALAKTIPATHLEVYAGVPVWEYYEAVTSLDFDISIAPVIAHPFNWCKSRRKFFESATLSAAFLCSEYRTYSIGIEHMTNAYKVKKNKAFRWTAGLKFLIENPEERHRLASNALDYVYKNHNAKDHIHKWITMYSGLVNGTMDDPTDGGEHVSTAS